MRNLARHPGLIVTACLLVAVAAVGFARLRGVEVPTAPVLRQDLEQHVVASGRVRVPTRVSIATQVPGLVIAVGASEGQRVQPGDLLLQLSDAEARAAVAQAKAAVDQASARVEQLRKVGAIVANETTRQAETNYARAAADQQRAEQLWRTGALSQMELDDARRSLEIARDRQPRHRVCRRSIWTDAQVQPRARDDVLDRDPRHARRRALRPHDRDRGRARSP